jgi:outer membrane protein TolC
MFRKQKVTLLLAGIFLLGNFVARAQDPVKLSRDEAVKMALKYNTDILNSEIDMKMAQKKIWETTASGLPHIDGKGTYTHTFKVPTMSFGGGTELSNEEVPFDPVAMTGTTSKLTLQSGETIYLNAMKGAEIQLGLPDNTTFDVTVSQLIFSGSYIVGLQASRVYFGMSKQSAEKTRLEVVETVRNTYNMIQLAEESKKILAQNLENIDKTLYEISEMHKQGFLEKTDVDQLELTGNTVRNAINQVNTNLELSYRLLKIQLGMDEGSKVVLTDQVENDQALTSSSMTLISEPFAIDRNVDFQMIQTNEKAAKLQLKLAQSAYLPTISGYYNHTEKLKKPAFDFSPKDMLGVNLSIPIFSSGEKMAVVSQRKMDLEKAQNTTKYVSSSIQMQATQYQSDLKLKLEKYQIQLKSKQLSDDIYQRTLEKYKQGVASSMDLMNSQNQYLTNLTNYYQAVYDLQSAKSKLEKLYNLNQEPK